ncbi:uncharacterized protein LOC117568689 [Drosophila albomicans]|uniref:Uncharacterized protein LOC117568689 n=1 Tax=Drosophila albomicans TaxID=7291 RepID=A0A6P8X2J1_DROAB|nr:uncharacterized protein LOC117568689 [Drosophila albomicans]
MPVAIVTQEQQVLSSQGVAMAMCDGLRMLLLLPAMVLAWSVVRVDATLDETLQHIPKLSHAQVALIADNATARCKLTPELCDWQLHLYEGHAFSVQLPQDNNITNSTSTTTSPSTSSTTSTTSSPPVETKPIPVIFTVPGSDQSHKLLIYAQVERQQSWTKLGKSQRQRQRRRRRRRRKLLANFKTVM